MYTSLLLFVLYIPRSSAQNTVQNTWNLLMDYAYCFILCDTFGWRPWNNIQYAENQLSSMESRALEHIEDSSLDESNDKVSVNDTNAICCWFVINTCKHIACMLHAAQDFIGCCVLVKYATNLTNVDVFVVVVVIARYRLKKRLS